MIKKRTNLNLGILLVLATILLQSCKVYNSKFITVSQAENIPTKVKIKTTDKKSFVLASIQKEGEQLFIDKLKSAYTNSAELIDKIQKIKIANKL